MYYLLEFFRKYHYFLLFLVLEIVSFTLLFRFNHYQGSVWFTSANGVAAGINRMYGDAVSYVDLKEVNRHLTDENTRLQTKRNNCAKPCAKPRMSLRRQNSA